MRGRSVLSVEGGVEMKKILTILLMMTLLVAGCTRATESPTPTKPQDIAKAFLQASDNDDIDTGLSLLSDDVVFCQEPLGIRVEGKAQLEAGLRENTAWHHRHTFTSPIEHINVSYEFLIRDGKICSILVVADSEDWARLTELTSGGIGIKLAFVEQGIKVEKFAGNSPAEEAGVILGDVITAVDGISYSKMREGEIILRIKGPMGSKVLLTIIREGMTDPIDMEVTRVDLNQFRY